MKINYHRTGATLTYRISYKRCLKWYTYAISRMRVANSNISRPTHKHHIHLKEKEEKIKLMLMVVLVLNMSRTGHAN